MSDVDVGNIIVSKLIKWKNVKYLIGSLHEDVMKMNA